MMRATVLWNRQDAARRGELDGPDIRGILVEREMRASPVIVREVRGQDASQMPLAENDSMVEALASRRADEPLREGILPRAVGRDRKSTRLNSSHSQISYAVFCLKKKKTKRTTAIPHTSRDRQ